MNGNDSSISMHVLGKVFMLDWKNFKLIPKPTFGKLLNPNLSLPLRCRYLILKNKSIV